MSCELCVDCDDYGCSGKDCHKKGKCVMTEECFNNCEGFIGEIPVFDFETKIEKLEKKGVI